MVFYSQLANNDLDQILEGLLSWDKIVLTHEYCQNYIQAIIFQCNQLDKTSYHARCTYNQHKQFGQYVHTYRKSRHTTWYIIYNKDKFNNIFIQHLVSNHLTLDEPIE